MATTKATNRVSLSIQLRKNVKKEQINSLLERIYRLSGCLACGLNGFDLHLVNESLINPAVNELAGAELDGIANVTQRF